MQCPDPIRGGDNVLVSAAATCQRCCMRILSPHCGPATLWPSHITSAHLPSPALCHLPDHAVASPIPAQVMCDVLDSEHVPHITNSRAKVSRVLNMC